MADLLTRPAVDQAIDETMPLFAPPPFEPTTKQLPHVAAERVKHDRYHRILQCLADHGAMAIWQIAERLGVPEHKISGRFGEMEREQLIEKTGTQNIKPGGRVHCNIYRLKERSLV
jgi:predicted transcriptional regulator